MRDYLLSLLAKSQSQAALADQDFRMAADRYAELRQRTLEKVVDWEWTSSNPRYDLDPFHFLNPTGRRGRSSRREPAVKDGKHEYGFDATGRVIAARQHTDSPDEYYEEFIERDADLVRSTHYHYRRDKKPLNCTRFVFDEGRPRSRHRAAQGGSASDVYIVEDRRIRFRCWQTMSHGRDPWGACEELVVKPSGVVELWQFFSPAKRVLVFSGDIALYDTMKLGA